jgi:hypothetical protein
MKTIDAATCLSLPGFWDLKQGREITAPGTARNRYTILRITNKTVSLRRIKDGQTHDMDRQVLTHWLNKN